MAITKAGAAIANHELGLLSDEMTEAILKACNEIIEGQHQSNFLLT